MSGGMIRQAGRGRAPARDRTGEPRPRAGDKPKARVSVRPAEPRDAEAICAAHKAAMRSKAGGSYTRREIEAWVGRRKPEDYLYAMTDGDEAVFVAGLRGVVVGFSSLKDDEVMAVYAAPGAPAGTGAALLAAVEAEARARGVRALQLMATLNAVGFYEKKGYARGGEVDFPMAGGVRLRMVEMRKEL